MPIYWHKKIVVLVSLAIVTLFIGGKANAISLDDIQLWIGSGTNHAALVIEWNAPEVFNNTTVSAPVANKTLVWGYRFNGTNATGTQMLEAIAAADPKLYVVADDYYGGTFIDGIGYNLNGNGAIGVTDGVNTNFFINGFSWDGPVNVDVAAPLNSGDLYWSGSSGPYWQLWNELGDSGGFAASPNRGSSAFWDPNSYTHGQWASSESGLDGLKLTDGSWIGFSVSAAGYDSNTNDPACAAFNNDEQAPPSPDGTYAAYICNTNDFAVQVVSTNNIYTRSPYNNPNAVLGRPTRNFIDGFGDGTVHRTKIVEPPYWTDAANNDVITEISSGGQITVKLGRKIYDNPGNPYGVGLIVFGNSYFFGNGNVDDTTDLESYDLSTGIYGHPTTVSVSQDGTNWFAYNPVTTLFPQNAYRWDDDNQAWTDEQLNPTKPLNPSVYGMDFSGQPAANELVPFVGATGGTGYNLSASGLPWIQYVRIQPGAGTYTVIDAIAAVNPVAVGDALSITPDNLVAGVTNLNFQKPSDLSQTLISLNFNSVSTNAKISTVSLHEFSSFAPVVGNVSSAYQLQARSLTDTNAVALQADIGLRVGNNYSGNGSDLRVYQWNCTNWTSQPFTFSPTNNQVAVAGVTNFTAFVVSQIVPPNLSAQNSTNGFAFQFAPVANCPHVLQRSTNLVNWTPICTNTPTSAQPVTWQDTNAPAGQAFYRLQITVP